MEILQVRVVLCGPFGSRPSRHVILYCSVEVYWTTHRERAGSCVAPVPSATFTAKHAHTCPGNWPERLNYEVTANPLQPRSDRTGKGRGPADERIRSRLRRASNQYQPRGLRPSNFRPRVDASFRLVQPLTLVLIPRSSDWSLGSSASREQRRKRAFARNGN